MPFLENPCSTYTQGAAGAAFTSLMTHLLAAQCLLNEEWPEDQFGRIKDGAKFDMIIVGSGTAGSILANRLTQIEEWKVLLVEAGDDPPLESIIPNFSGATHRSSHAWQYYTEKDKSTNRGCVDGRSFWPRGKVIGGTGSINGLLHMRGSQGDYEPWHTESHDGWDWPTLKQYFIKSEKIIDPFILNNPELLKEHGTDGELIVDKLNSTHIDFVNKLMEGYKEMGLTYLDDLNGPTQKGFGKIRGTNHKGRRVSTATAFLSPIRNRKNLYVLKNTFVNKILIDENNNMAKGISVTLKNGVHANLYALKEIIVSAGAVNTPVLLMLSGIGPRKHLEDVEINVIADLPVGKNLQDHVRIPIPVTIDTQAKQLEDKFWLKAAAEYLLEQTGPHTINFDQPNINAFLSVPDEKNLPDVQIDHNYFPPNTSYVYTMCSDTMSFRKEICKQFAEFNKEKELLIFFVSLCRPLSKGKILLRSKESKDYPKIYSKYFSDGQDLKIFVNSLKRVMEIVNTPTFKSMKAEIKRIHFKDCDDKDFLSNDYWECMARTVTYNVYHPVGTAKMGGSNDETAVVDKKLRVRGIQRLRIIDASVMPTIPSVNTNAATMMIAERGADFIKEEYDVLKKRDEL